MNNTGFLIIGIVLIVVIAILIGIIIYLSIKLNNQTSNQCVGGFGVIAGKDNVVLNQCGTNGTSPCTFSVDSVAAAINKCNVLSNVCDTFSFNPSRKEMKIINLNGASTNVLTDIYSRQ